MHKTTVISKNSLVVEQALRCFMVPAKEEEKGAPKIGSELSEEAKSLEAASHPFGGLCLILDTETFPFKQGQRARIGAYQLRGISRDNVSQ